MRLEGRFALAGSAGGHGAEGAAVVAVVAGNELVLVRMTALAEVLAGELQRRLDGFRASAEGFHVVEIPRRHAPQPLDEVQSDIRDRVQRGGKSERLHLSAHGVHHTRMSVPKHGDEDAADTVEIALAVSVPVVEALRPVDNQGKLVEIGRLAVVQERVTQ